MPFMHGQGAAHGRDYGLQRDGRRRCGLQPAALRDRYDVSVNTLRETLSRLAADGLVEAEGQRGFTVVPATLADLIDITETRRLLECHATRLSVERADLEWESGLVAAYHKLSKAEEMVAKAGDKHAD